MSKQRAFTVAALAALCALAALPAAAPTAKHPKQRPPEIRSTSIALDDALGAVNLTATVSRASHVSATVGTGSVRQQLQLERTSGGRTADWTAQAAQGLETCLPIRFVARNSAGRDVHEEDGCVFGVTGPPPSFSFPFIPVR